MWLDLRHEHFTHTAFFLLVEPLENVSKYLFWVNFGNPFLGADHQSQPSENLVGDYLLMFQGHEEDLEQEIEEPVRKKVRKFFLV